MPSEQAIHQFVEENILDTPSSIPLMLRYFMDYAPGLTGPMRAALTKAIRQAQVASAGYPSADQAAIQNFMKSMQKAKNEELYAFMRTMSEEIQLLGRALHEHGHDERSMAWIPVFEALES